MSNGSFQSFNAQTIQSYSHINEPYRCTNENERHTLFFLPNSISTTTQAPHWEVEVKECLMDGIRDDEEDEEIGDQHGNGGDEDDGDTYISI